MPFDANRLALTVDSIGGGSLRIHFLRTDDDRDEVTAPGYLRFASRLGVREGDVVIVYNEALADLDSGTYLTRVAPDFVNGHATLIEDVGEKPLPPFHFRINDGEGGVSATYERVRELLEIDHLPNKTEEEMVASGAISEALATKATPADIEDKVSPIRTDLTRRATVIYVDESVAPISRSLGNLSEDFGELQDEVDALAAGQASDAIIAKTWPSLSSTPPTRNGAKAEIPGTAITTHNDPVATGNPVVPDPGTYRGSLSPLGWERVGPTTAAAAAAEVGKGIGTTTLPLGPNYGVVFKNLVTGELVDLTNPDSIAWIQEIAVPTVYTKEIFDAVVTDTSSIILAGDLQRVGDISIQVPADFEVGLNFTDNPAVFEKPGTWLQRSGEWVNHPNPGTGALAAICRRVSGSGAATCTLNVRVTRKVDGPLPSKLADAIFARWTDPVDPRYKAVIRAEVDILAGYSIYEKLHGWWMPGSTKNNFRVNLADPNGPLLVYTEGESGLAFTPYKSIKGDGISASIDTTLSPQALNHDTAGHFLAAKVVGSGGENSKAMIGNSANRFIGAGSVNGVYRFGSGAAAESNTDNPKADGKWAALSRVADPNNFSAYVDGELVFTRARTFTAVTDRTLKILGTSGAGGAANLTSLPCGGAAAGAALSAVSVNRFNESCKRIEAACAQILGA